MRVAKLVDIQKIVVSEEAFDKKPAPGQVVVQVKAVGICGTDFHIFEKGRDDVQLPRVMGHELSGVVVETGEGVENVKAGDHVVMDPVIACKSCKTCLSGHANVCENVKCFGVQMDGGFQDYILVDADRLYSYPESISFEEAALVEPFSVASNSINRTQGKEGDRVVVIGTGTIGLCLIQALKGLKAQILAGDIEEKKLQAAERFGADRVINTKETDLCQAVEKFYPGGADVIIDAVGVSGLTQMAVDMAAPCARIAVIAFDSRPMEIPPVKITKKELTLIGSRMNLNRFPEVLKWMNDGMIRPKDMITAVYPVEQIQEAFEKMMERDGASIKTIIRF